MSQAMNIGTYLIENSVSSQTKIDKKNYSVNFKGLMSHLADVLFVSQGHKEQFYTGELSAHLQRDIGIYR
ncbi:MULTISPECIES: hypothetical protein [Vibrio]|uniref:Uncharacterized protein n=2 Tax=Vibrio TaxID=662 RepID=A0A7X4RUW4_9VIBR|nr:MULTISPECIES: hypothetical protein [Vibrio]MBF9002667.1 hypothetical protein [Vibrio nitrifigilis]MZI93938.1 hypothetical protein [Vibrio eleionomae]